MSDNGLNTFGARSALTVGRRTFSYFSLPAFESSTGRRIARLPFCLKILLENLLRNEDGVTVTSEDIAALAEWAPGHRSEREIAFRPARVLMQDFTGVPAVADLAAMRDALAELGGDPSRINPLVPAELVIDHSVQVDAHGSSAAFSLNLEKEFERNQERYAFLRWGQSAFRNCRVVPPGTGIVHQVNMEYLARVVFDAEADGELKAYFDTVIGTDSHTTMINGLGVLGWGVGGIEAEAAMLGQPVSMLIPEVVGCRLSGELAEGVTATDLVLTVTQSLRRKGVVGKFVEFFGPGLAGLSVADRATIANMAPEYGATCGIFPIDEETLAYLRLSARPVDRLALVESYVLAQDLLCEDRNASVEYSDVVELDLGLVEASLAGPRRPQDRVSLSAVKSSFEELLRQSGRPAPVPDSRSPGGQSDVDAVQLDLRDGAVVIAAITSCTNTSNPSVMLAAGLLAKKAVERGLGPKPWVKASLAPGSKVVTEYLRRAGLDQYLDRLGFNLVGYGCTTCIGNSGPLSDEVARAVADNRLVVCAVLSGNRNFEGRISPDVRANYLASPPLVVAYALVGRIDVDLTATPLGRDALGREVYLREIWPSRREVLEAAAELDRDMFAAGYADVFAGDQRWRDLPVPRGDRYVWDPSSTYVKRPPFLDGLSEKPAPLRELMGMSVLAVLGDSITTDHISPAGSISARSEAGRYLIELGVAPADFNSYGARRGNHEVMLRGAFGSGRLRNLLTPGVEGSFTKHPEYSEPVSIYQAAMRYQAEDVPLLIIAGKEYGAGSSRDWAAKGPRLLGIKAVLAESFERIHRSNLVGMGILPLQFETGQSREALGLTGFERFDVLGVADGLPGDKRLAVAAWDDKRRARRFSVVARVDTPNELEYYRHGGILPYVLRSLLKS
jgi:aconitate hydratase